MSDPLTDSKWAQQSPERMAVALEILSFGGKCFDAGCTKEWPPGELAAATKRLVELIDVLVEAERR